MSGLNSDIWCGMGDERRFVIGPVSADMPIGYHRKGAAKIGAVVYGSFDDVRRKIMERYPGAKIIQ